MDILRERNPIRFLFLLYSRGCHKKCQGHQVCSFFVLYIKINHKKWLATVYGYIKRAKPNSFSFFCACCHSYPTFFLALEESIQYIACFIAIFASWFRFANLSICSFQRLGKNSIAPINQKY